jgi:hypothetical protein
MFSICVRIRIFGVLRGYLQTMSPRENFGAVNSAEMPRPRSLEPRFERFERFERQHAT